MCLQVRHLRGPRCFLRGSLACPCIDAVCLVHTPPWSWPATELSRCLHTPCLPRAGRSDQALSPCPGLRPLPSSGSWFLRPISGNAVCPHHICLSFPRRLRTAWWLPGPQTLLHSTWLRLPWPLWAPRPPVSVSPDPHLTFPAPGSELSAAPGSHRRASVLGRPARPTATLLCRRSPVSCSIRPSSGLLLQTPAVSPAMPRASVTWQYPLPLLDDSPVLCEQSPGRAGEAQARLEGAESQNQTRRSRCSSLLRVSRRPPPGRARGSGQLAWMHVLEGDCLGRGGGLTAPAVTLPSWQAR